MGTELDLDDVAATSPRAARELAELRAENARLVAEIERLRTALENQRRECDRAWREVDAIARERDDHHRWRQDLADELGEVEKHRDAIAVTLRMRENDLMALRNATDAMMAVLGYHGSICARDDCVQAVMDCLWKIDTTPARGTSAQRPA